MDKLKVVITLEFPKKPNFDHDLALQEMEDRIQSLHFDNETMKIEILEEGDQ